MTEYLRQGTYPMLIDGEEAVGADGATFETWNPATGRVLARVAQASASDVDRAVLAARKAYDTHWRRMSSLERGRLLRKLAEAIARRVERVAWVETWNVGKPIALSRASIAAMPEVLDYFAGVSRAISGETINTSDTSILNYSVREPIGVCALVLPWNYPFTMAVYKMTPTLAAGNTVVIKASEITPLSIVELGDAVREAGFPPGVINIVHGDGAQVGAQLVNHPLVDKVSFTGGTATGKAIFRAAADRLKHVTLELGGKSPLILFDDGDVDQAVKTATDDAIRNTGQVCTSCTRLLVAESRADEFVEKMRIRQRAIRIGLPQDEATEMGPLVSRAHFEKVRSYVEVGQGEGASPEQQQDITARAELREGNFCAPTLFVTANNGMRVAREEIFGPAQSVIRFRGEDDALRIANDTRYGLAAVVYTRDTGRALRVARDLQVGNVAINQPVKASVDAPFGGYKESGFGKERGVDAILDNMQLKNVKMSML